MKGVIILCIFIYFLLEIPDSQQVGKGPALRGYKVPAQVSLNHEPLQTAFQRLLYRDVQTPSHYLLHLNDAIWADEHVLVAFNNSPTES